VALTILRVGKDENAVVVANCLGKVQVALDALSIDVGEGGTEDGHGVVALEAQGNVLARARKVLATPLERAVVVANVVVEVEARVDLLAVFVGALADEDVAVLELNVLGAKVEVDHDDGFDERVPSRVVQEKEERVLASSPRGDSTLYTARKRHSLASTS
jgi:hypothetical protein